MFDMDIEGYARDYTNARNGGPIANPLDMISTLLRNPIVAVSPRPHVTDKATRQYKWKVGEASGVSIGLDQLIRDIIAITG